MMSGWKLVPVEPAQQQIHAAYEEQPQAINVGLAQAYRTMVENAPAAPTMPVAAPFIWICLAPAGTETNPDPDPRIRAWTANEARAIELTASGLDMVPVYVRPLTRDEAFDAYRRTMTRIVDDLRARLDKVKTETEAALRARSDAQAAGLSVEAVAACIDPVAFDPISLDDKHPGWGCRREQATETAKKIIALASQPSPAAMVEIDVLSRLVDWTYLHATEGEVWPSSKTKADLITRARQDAPRQEHADGMKAVAPQRSSAESDPLDDLVSRFSKALLAKLKLAKANGRSGWEQNDWEEHCQRGLLRHVEKGDPRDVAAYCAFAWHHGWATRTFDQPQSSVTRVIELLEERPAAALRALVIEECAKILDEAAQDWRRIRDPGMANNAAAYAKRIRALSLSRPNSGTTK